MTTRLTPTIKGALGAYATATAPGMIPISPVGTSTSARLQSMSCQT